MSVVDAEKEQCLWKAAKLWLFVVGRNLFISGLYKIDFCWLFLGQNRYVTLFDSAFVIGMGWMCAFDYVAFYSVCLYKQNGVS